MPVSAGDHHGLRQSVAINEQAALDAPFGPARADFFPRTRVGALAIDPFKNRRGHTLSHRLSQPPAIVMLRSHRLALRTEHQVRWTIQSAFVSTYRDRLLVWLQRNEYGCYSDLDPYRKTFSCC